jgi:hypothetical protein
MGAVVGDTTPVSAQTSISPDLPGHRRRRSAELRRDASAGHLSPQASLNEIALSDREPWSWHTHHLRPLLVTEVLQQPLEFTERKLLLLRLLRRFTARFAMHSSYAARSFYSLGSGSAQPTSSPANTSVVTNFTTGLTRSSAHASVVRVSWAGERRRCYLVEC